MMFTRTLPSCLFAFGFIIFSAQPLLACMDHGDEAPYIPMEEEQEEEPTEVEEDGPDSDEGDEALFTTLRLPVSVEAEEVPPAQHICSSDLECPSGMLCEAIECCEAEDCECPEALCQWSETGAQGRDCLSDEDCGAGYLCQHAEPAACDDPSDPMCHEGAVSWCEAIEEAVDISGDAVDVRTGCQGGSQQSLPLWIALSMMVSAFIRRTVLA